MTNPLLRGLVDLLRPSVQRPCVLTASRRTVIMPADLPTLQRSPMPRQRLSSTGVTEYPARIVRSFRFEPCGRTLTGARSRSAPCRSFRCSAMSMAGASSHGLAYSSYYNESRTHLALEKGPTLMGWGASVILPVGLAIQPICARFPKFANHGHGPCGRI